MTKTEQEAADKAKPFCKDCKHCINRGSLYARCALTDIIYVNNVTGKIHHSEDFCSDERGLRGGCKPSGKNFEPMEEPSFIEKVIVWLKEN